jgi:hypothetical protein
MALTIRPTMLSPHPPQNKPPLRIIDRPGTRRFGACTGDEESSATIMNGMVAVAVSELLVAIIGAAVEMVMEGISGLSGLSLSEQSLSSSSLTPKVILGICGRVEDDISSSLVSMSSSEAFRLGNFTP